MPQKQRLIYSSRQPQEAGLCPPISWIWGRMCREARWLAQGHQAARAELGCEPRWRVLDERAVSKREHSLLTLSNLSTTVHFVSVWQGLSKIDNLGTSLAVQLRFQTSIAGSMGSVPSQGTKIPHALRYRWKNKI